MANRFWVGGGSANTWAATANTNWATTSGGSNNASVPTTTDVAIFDSNSGSGNSVIGASITVQGVDCTGGTGTYAGTITHNTAVTLTVNTGAASSLRFTGGMTYTPASSTSLVTFSNTTGTAQLTSAGKAFAAITLSGVGGTVQQQDTLNINAVQNAILTITNGVWDCNSNALTAIVISSSNSNVRSFLLGSSVTVGGNTTNSAAIWLFGTTTNLTFTKGSANIIVLAPTLSSVIGLQFTAGTLTYNNITFNATTNQCVAFFGATSFSCAALTFNSGWSVIVTSGQTITATSFTGTGTQANPVAIFSNSNTAVATLSVASGSSTLTWGSVLNITATGGATFTATNSFGFGTNAGWSISPPAASTFTPAALATAIWQDATAGDFTVAGSIGKDLFVGGIQPGNAGGHFIAGTNAATSITTALTANVTGNITGNLSGSVGSVTGAVGSVTARVTANTDQIAGSATAATNFSKTALVVGRGTVGSGSTTTSVVTSTYSIAGKSGPRAIIFDPATTTTNLQGQGVAITSSTGGATPTFTVATLTDAPVSGDTFSVV